MGKLEQRVIEVIAKRQKLFMKAVPGFEDRGILNSEMACVCALSQSCGLDLLIESGRFRGQSTQVLANYFLGSQTKIASIELFRDANARYVEEKLKNRTNLDLFYGDAANLIPRFVRENPGKAIGMLFDGPKGQLAIDIFRYCLTLSPNIKVGFFHDMRRPTAGMPNKSREIMERNLANCFFSDSQKYVAKFGKLDQVCLGKFWEPFKLHGAEIGSYGPTIGVTIPVSEDYRRANKEKLELTVKVVLAGWLSRVIVSLSQLKKWLRL